jgi:Fe-Mn family superoxide dismutase
MTNEALDLQRSMCGNKIIRNMKKTLSYLIPIMLCFAVGALGSYLQTSALAEWYPTLRRSSLTPPNIVFPIAWSVLYLLMGVSIGTLVSRGDMSVVRLWLFQLLVNFLWSVTFFAMRSPLAGLITILVLDVLVFAYIIYAASRRPLASWLFVPYLLWLIFATYLNGYIYKNNHSTAHAVQASTLVRQTTINHDKVMNYSMPTLPYSADALVPLMSRETINYHYGKHLQTYVDNLNRLVVGSPCEGMTLENVVKCADGALFNNAAQVWNHTLFFDGLTPLQQPMPKRLQSAIERDFGSVDNFKEQFTQAATSLFGSGWVWLVQNNDGGLAIVSTSNAGTPLRDEKNPLLTLDVWEHAYYIDHRNRRIDFIQDWWKLVDWDKADARMKHS